MKHVELIQLHIKTFLNRNNSYTKLLARIVSRFLRKLKLSKEFDCMRTKPLITRIVLNISKSCSVNSGGKLKKSVNFIDYFYLVKFIAFCNCSTYYEGRSESA